MRTWTMSPASSACSSASYFDPARRGDTRLYVPVTLLPLLHQRVASYPNALAEGGANFWDAFQVVPVGDHFWHDGVRLEVFPTRHHWPDTSFGLRLRGSVVWTGDTRPIPEMLAKFADAGELVAHDCALHGNPSHSGIDDLEREYPRELLDRCLLYHYASAADGEALAARGYRVAKAGEVIAIERAGTRTRSNHRERDPVPARRPCPGLAPRRARAPPARPAPVGDRSLQFPLPVLHAGRPRARGPRLRCGARACRSTRSRRWCAASPASA